MRIKEEQSSGAEEEMCDQLSDKKEPYITAPMQIIDNQNSRCNGKYDHSKDVESRKEVEINRKKRRSGVTFEHTQMLLKKKNLDRRKGDARNESVCKENKENFVVKTGGDNMKLEVK